MYQIFINVAVWQRIDLKTVPQIRELHKSEQKPCETQIKLKAYLYLNINNISFVSGLLSKIRSKEKLNQMLSYILKHFNILNSNMKMPQIHNNYKLLAPLV